MRWPFFSIIRTVPEVGCSPPTNVPERSILDVATVSLVGELVEMGLAATDLKVLRLLQFLRSLSLEQTSVITIEKTGLSSVYH
jgi:hypothetical protein